MHLANKQSFNISLNDYRYFVSRCETIHTYDLVAQVTAMTDHTGDQSVKIMHSACKSHN